jgi:hypothetical protein
MIAVVYILRSAYTGAEHVRFVYRFAIRLQQESSGATVDAIVNGPVGDSFVGMQAQSVANDPTGALYNLRLALKTTWQVKLRSVAFSGAKYFLVESIDAT